MDLPSSNQGGQKRASLRLLARLLLTIAVIVCVGFAVKEFRSQSLLHGKTVTARREDAAIPVTLAATVRRDTPIYVTSLGTVQASDTVAIHAEVDGKLESVAFAEGDEVHQGDLLAQLDNRMFQAALDQAKAKQGADEAQLLGAQKDLERFQNLAAKNAESIQNVDRQQALVDQIKANIEADKAAIEIVQTQLDHTSITAPIDGRVGIRQIDPGNIVHANDVMPIVTLTRMKPITVQFSLPEKNLGAIRDAIRKGPLSVVAFDQDDQQELAEGAVDIVDNQVDPATDTIRLKGVFPNRSEELWPGQFVNVRLQIEMRKNAIGIPTAAIQHGPSGLYVWVVGPDERVAIRPIEVGPPEKDFTIITSGLAEGERVVVDGEYRLQSNARITETDTATPGTSRAYKENSS
jgi:multidrug efflux system membrane fusion protein